MSKYVVSNFNGYLHVDNSDVDHWVRSPFSADKFSDRARAEEHAKIHDGVVVEIPDTPF
jgi:hypothetical protein